jgi:hypothetical protein
MNTVDQLRPVAGDVEAGTGKVICGHVFEDGGLLLVILELWNRGDRTVAIGATQLNLDDPICVRIGQRLEQHGIYHRKDRCVGADTER